MYCNSRPNLKTEKLGNERENGTKSKEKKIKKEEREEGEEGRF